MPEFRPDPDHDAVMDSTARHLVVTAPPGTGKTFLSIRLAGHLASTLPYGARVLLLTFSTQARTQLEQEARRQLSRSLRERVEVTNYHRFFWYGVLAYRRALGLPMQLDVGSRGRREEALRRADAVLVDRLKQAAGLTESLAEHSFAQFRDDRTPDEEALGRVLAVVRAEQQAGRLVFDDLGALFWSLLERYPVVEQAYQSRYPVVIADEHQDASALQDALVRRLGRDRLVIFADPMQLIHEFRGASQARLDRQLEECDESLTLGTAHRWHGTAELGHWLLALRARLEGHGISCPRPPQVRVEHSPASRGFNGMKPYVKNAVTRAFDGGASSVAVLARGNKEVGELRSYLSQNGQYPRQVGTEDFEDARRDVEQLPFHTAPEEVVLHAVGRLDELVSTLPARVMKQVRARVLSTGVNLKGAGDECTRILEALEPIYRHGPSAYFESMAGALDSCARAGHHLPRTEAVRALTLTAAALKRQPAELDWALQRYSAAVVDAANTAPRTSRGLFVMTAHQAKGKEFDAVVLADAMDRFWRDDDDHRRLFYVAVTRASKSWTFVAPDQRASQLLKLL